MENYLLISDAAKEVQVESHVLRYWEEELHLPIRRNELGHRYYTKEDVERFKQIKGMKERGLQLKAIKMILKDGKIDVMIPEAEKEAIRRQEELDGQTASAEGNPEEHSGTGSGETDRREAGLEVGFTEEARPAAEGKEEKARRLQWLLQQMIRETIQENNKELCRDIRESVVKELDYQFRIREEREEEWERARQEREEQHYRKIDELLRTKNRRRSPSREEREARRILKAEGKAQKSITVREEKAKPAIPRCQRKLFGKKKRAEEELQNKSS